MQAKPIARDPDIIIEDIDEKINPNIIIRDCGTFHMSRSKRGIQLPGMWRFTYTLSRG